MAIISLHCSLHWIIDASMGISFISISHWSLENMSQRVTTALQLVSLLGRGSKPTTCKHPTVRNGGTQTCGERERNEVPRVQGFGPRAREFMLQRLSFEFYFKLSLS